MKELEDGNCNIQNKWKSTIANGDKTTKNISLKKSFVKYAVR